MLDNPFEFLTPAWHERANEIREARAVADAARVEKLREEGISGVLVNAFFNDNKHDPRYPNIVGRIDIDAKGRFNFWDLVYTSRLKKIYAENGRTFAKTHYSLYELIGFDPESIPEDFRFAFQDL
jgi:hypothetical protein